MYQFWLHYVLAPWSSGPNSHMNLGIQKRTERETDNLLVLSPPEKRIISAVQVLNSTYIFDKIVAFTLLHSQTIEYVFDRKYQLLIILILLHCKTDGTPHPTGTGTASIQIQTNRHDVESF